MSAHAKIPVWPDRPSGTEPHAQSVAQVLSALDTDARSGLSEAEAEQRLERYGRNELATEKPVPAWRKFLAQFTDVLVILLLVATRSRRRCGSTSANPRCLTKRWRSSPSCCSTPSWATSRSRAPRRRWRRCGRCRRRTPTSSATATRQSIPATEVVPGDIILIEEGDTIPADAPRDSVDRAADRRGGADRREPAGGEGHSARSRRGRARRPAQHDLQRHGGDLRARASGGHRDRDADRDGAHRRHAAGRRRTRPRRCRRSSTASASCSASSSSSSPS